MDKTVEEIFNENDEHKKELMEQYFLIDNLINMKEKQYRSLIYKQYEEINELKKKKAALQHELIKCEFT